MKSAALNIFVLHDLAKNETNLQETLNTRKQKTDSENPYNRLLGLKFKNKFKKKFENKLKTS